MEKYVLLLANMAAHYSKQIFMLSYDRVVVGVLHLKALLHGCFPQLFRVVVLFPYTVSHNYI